MPSPDLTITSDASETRWGGGGGNQQNYLDKEDGSGMHRPTHKYFKINGGEFCNEDILQKQK